MDSRAQIMIKGYESLSKVQKILIDKYFPTMKSRKYVGLDKKTRDQINTILNGVLKETGEADDKVSGVQGAIKKILELDFMKKLPKYRATTIAETEIAQSIEGSRYIMYDGLYGADGENRWSYVGDNRVRDTHDSIQGNSTQGWIPMHQAFKSGEQSPAEAIKCRCSVQYRRKQK
jgi:hypothetical protein